MGRCSAGARSRTWAQRLGVSLHGGMGTAIGAWDAHWKKVVPLKVKCALVCEDMGM